MDWKLREWIAAPRARHREMAQGLTQEVGSLDEAKQKSGMVVSGWCGKDDCATHVETTLNMKTIRAPEPREDPGDRVCITCGEKAKEVVRFAATY